MRIPKSIDEPGYLVKIADGIYIWSPAYIIQDQFQGRRQSMTLSSYRAADDRPTTTKPPLDVTNQNTKAEHSATTD